VILELDAGNTRIKWRVIDGKAICARGAELHAENWQGHIENVLGCSPGRVRVANVAGVKVQQTISGWVKDRWGINAEFADTNKGVGEVTHIYSQPERLGIDRWLTLLAARKSHAGVSIVVDAGSAVTLDVIDQHGQHLGGFIVPGLDMQRKALFGATSDVKVADSDRLLTTDLGVDTSSAVINGGVAMVAGMVELMCRRYPEVLLLVSGGDGEALLPFLPAAEFRGELVMDGLAVMMP
jgi:type III pantothenate kinase